MFVDWEKAIPKPPQDVLDGCQKVTMFGLRKPHEKKRWAVQHCKSFVYMDTGYWSGDDGVYTFYFGDEADKLMFLLKWK